MRFEVDGRFNILNEVDAYRSQLTAEGSLCFKWGPVGILCINSMRQVTPGFIRFIKDGNGNLIYSGFIGSKWDINHE